MAAYCDARETALAKRHLRDTSETRRELKSLVVGDSVQIQNQKGNRPKKWHNTGIIAEGLPNRQYRVITDGSRRPTLRNRRFLQWIDPVCRKLVNHDTPIIHQPVPTNTIADTQPPSAEWQITNPARRIEATPFQNHHSEHSPHVRNELLRVETPVNVLNADDQPVAPAATPPLLLPQLPADQPVTPAAPPPLLLPQLPIEHESPTRPPPSKASIPKRLQMDGHGVIPRRSSRRRAPPAPLSPKLFGPSHD